MSESLKTFGKFHLPKFIRQTVRCGTCAKVLSDTTYRNADEDGEYKPSESNYITLLKSDPNDAIIYPEKNWCKHK